MPSPESTGRSFRENSGQKSQKRHPHVDEGNCNRRGRHEDADERPIIESGWFLDCDTPIGRAGSVLTFGWEEILTHEVEEDALLNKVYKTARQAKRQVSKSGKAHPEMLIGIALAKARELAERVELPKRARVLEQNRRWPIYWDRDWQAKLLIPNPTSEVLLMEDYYNLPIISREAAIKFALHDWDDYYHFGCVPNNVEREQYENLDTNEAYQDVVNKILASGVVDQYKATTAYDYACPATTVGGNLDVPSGRGCWTLDAVSI